MAKIIITIEGTPIDDLTLDISFNEAMPFTPFYKPPQKKGVKPRALRRSPVRKVPVEEYLKEKEKNNG